MSVRIALVIATLILGSNVAYAGTKHTNTACTEHVKAMKALKTSAERTSYCKEHADCESNHCEKMMAHHKSGAKHSAAATPAPATAPATK